MTCLSLIGRGVFRYCNISPKNTLPCQFPGNMYIGLYNPLTPDGNIPVACCAGHADFFI
jgi:hypothetical protein